jgi:predicted nucleotidyltransferase
MLLEILSKVEHPIEVWAYGSRVNGGAHDGSDLDLVMRTMDDAPLPMAVYAETVERIRQSNIPILVQLFDLNRLPKEFQQNIRGSHEVIFSNHLGMASEPLPTYGS